MDWTVQVSSVAEQLPDLVDRIEAGDRVAEKEFVERYARYVLMVVLGRTGSPQLANELCQDNLIVA
jgi:DNA-directed RNA polymerase specialized sigma24 family protein